MCMVLCSVYVCGGCFTNGSILHWCLELTRRCGDLRFPTLSELLATEGDGGLRGTDGRVQGRVTYTPLTSTAQILT